jgi:glycosyltransferase involved in cell wall biosynthesis
MRVLIAVTRFPPDFAGGAERRFHAMALAAARLGHDVEVLATNAYARFPSGPVDGIPVRRLEWPAGVDSAAWEAVTHVAEVLRSERPPDVVWTGNAAMGLAVRRVWPTVPLIFAPGEMVPLGWKARVGRAWQRWRSEGRAVSQVWWRREAVVDRLVSEPCTTAMPSVMNVEYVTSGRSASWLSVQVLPRGVEVDRWTPAAALRRWAPDCALRVLVACRLVPRKNVEQVVEAVARCRNRSVRLQICGDGPHEQALRNLATERGVAERVEFLGMREDMLAVYAGADVFVMSSNFEPYPNTVSEALASGCPVLIRRPAPPRVMIGIYEYVADCGACLAYGTDDADELAGHLDRLAEQPARLSEMGRQAVEWARRRDWQHLIGNYLPGDGTAKVVATASSSHQAPACL